VEKLRQLTIPLAVLTAAALLLLGTSASLNRPGATNRAWEHHRVMALLLPGSTVFSQEVYTGDDANITAVFRGQNGYVVETTLQGYVDELVLWVGVSDQGSVTGVTIRDMAETWGLGGSAVTDLRFLEQFLHTTGNAQLGENIQALTGATVTSKEVLRGVNSAAAFVTGADVSSGATEWGG
jgi:electron transport complex protein RnfG